MHIVVTNLVTWVMTVYKESEHVVHLADVIKGCDDVHENKTSDMHDDDDNHRRKRSAEGESDCAQPLSLNFKEFFYPFQIEFVLIGKNLASSNLILFSRRHCTYQHLESHCKA